MYVKQLDSVFQTSCFLVRSRFENMVRDHEKQNRDVLLGEANLIPKGSAMMADKPILQKKI